MSAQLSENDELVLGPIWGLVVGTVMGGMVTTLVVPQFGLDISWPAPWFPWLMSALLGLLYGACQLRVPIRGLVAVGIFYGVFLWVLTNLVGWLLSPNATAQIRSWPGIGSFILFTAGLGLTSVMVTLSRGGQGTERAQH
jgi:hypothetical protein